ncbi:hypothetical protein R4227_18560 [Gordonia amicalis]|uniref:hypothetical protein n=1 Tax=Gordonia amicalis TaxID=89053 RepID=UPI002953712C|nr:hypothetical protein [Gordonia amicalis]MDV7102064.1 hypothetical protein [Gordonia amicalis]
MAFWWASQGNNHEIAIDQGSLWTCPWWNGRVPIDRALIKEIQPGDTVFHYKGPSLRAVSVALTSWESWPRPAGYPAKGKDDPDDGWLVRVEPIITGLAIHRDRLAEIVPLGSPGPLNRFGGPQQKYLSAIDPSTGQALLSEIDVEVPKSETVKVASSDDERMGGATDVAMTGTARVEQRALRTFLIGTQTEAQCGLCGRTLPTELLVAGHIKPRSQCSEVERWDFAAVAMLNCTLGCDALFERGYITVDGDGCVQSGRAATSAAVSDSVAALLGKKALAHNVARAAAFDWHRTRSLSVTGAID